MLVDLLVNKNAYNISHGGPSKGISYLPNQISFHLTDRVRWQNSTPSEEGQTTLLSELNLLSDGYDNERDLFEELNTLTDPIFNRGNDHGGNEKNVVDGFIRGQLQTNLNRRALDITRISNFLYDSPQGRNFLLRQGILQLLNPQENTRTFNAGVSLLAQIGAGSEVRFKRHGLIPEPVDFDYNQTIGRKVGDALGGKFGDFVENAFGGDYLTTKMEQLREDLFGLGDVGKKTVDVSKLGGFVDTVFGGVADHFRSAKNDTPYNVKAPLNKLDRVNATEIFGNFALDTDLENLPNLMDYVGSERKNQFQKFTKDFCNFRFDVINSDNTLYHKSIVFRAFLETFGDQYTANHNQIKMNGRGELFYTYNSFMRKIQISFKIAAQTRDEMRPIYQKLNYLVAQTAPNYSKKGRIRTPYVKLTMGDYLRKVPGLINSVNVNWNKDYPWDIRLDPEGLDRDMKVLPHVLDVNVQFTPIHSFVPDNEVDTPFISLNKDTNSPDWLPYNTKPADQIGENQETKRNDKQIEEVCAVEIISSGNYLYNMAKKHNMSVCDIATFNNIPCTDDAYRSLSEGTEINIPCTTQ
tara:strand:+ start:1478 stop:3217 length:1740 start_codon:yes stop_codon:yes gene_type:complete